MRHFTTFLFLLSSTACGIDHRPDSADDVEPNAGGPDAPRCDLGVPFSAPIPVPELNTDAQESGARLTADELTLYFASDRAGGAGGYDLYRATRASIHEPFASIEWLSTLATPGDERDPQPSSAGSFVLFAQDGDIVESSFDGSTFSPATALDALNTRGLERSPALTENALYLSSNGRIMESAIVYGALLPPQPVEALDTGDEDMSIVVNRKDTSMLLARRPAGTRSTQIWRTQRDPVLGSYETPVLLMEATTSLVSLVPSWLSEDGCVMYLESTETGDFDIYVARRSL